MITFNQDIELQIVVDFDETHDQPIVENETFKKGELVDGDIIDDEPDSKDPFCTIEFGDGSVAYCVDRALFTVVKDK